MTNARLFGKLRKLIEDASSADKQHIRKIRKILRKLKERQHDLRDSLEDIENPVERQKIEQEIEVITLQRRKGTAVYKQLKEARKQSKKNVPGKHTVPGEGAP